MKTKIIAVVASSLLAASSFAQTSSLNAPTALRVEETMMGESLTLQDEVAFIPLLAGLVAGALVTEVLHHHFAMEATALPDGTSTKTAEALFDR